MAGAAPLAPVAPVAAVLEAMAATKRCALFEVVLTAPFRMSPALTFLP